MATVTRIVKQDGDKWVCRFAGTKHEVKNYNPDRHPREIFIQVDRYGCPVMSYSAMPFNTRTEIGKVVDIEF